MVQGTLYNPNQVSRIRKNWVVIEDEALALQLQGVEINNHYRGNRTRNEQIREDTPHAIHEQEVERRKAQKQWMQNRRDELLALELQQRRNGGANHRCEISANRNGSDNHVVVDEEKVENDGDVSFHDLNGGLTYNDHQYRVHEAVPLVIHDDNNVNVNEDSQPIYVNNNVQQISQNDDFDLIEQCPTTTELIEPQQGCSKSATDSRKTVNLRLIQTSDDDYTTDEDDGRIKVGSLRLTPYELAMSRKAEEVLQQEKKDRELAEEMSNILEHEKRDVEEKQISTDIKLAKKLAEKEQEKLKRAKARARAKRLKRQEEKKQQMRLSSTNLSDQHTELIQSSSFQHETLSEVSSSTNETPPVQLPARRPVINTRVLNGECHTSSNAFEPTLPHLGHHETGSHPPRKVQNDSNIHVYENLKDFNNNTEETSTQIWRHSQHSACDIDPHFTESKTGSSNNLNEKDSFIHHRSSSASEICSPKYQEQSSSSYMSSQPPPYMPMQKSSCRKSSSIEKRISRKKQKEGCSQQ